MFWQNPQTALEVNCGGTGIAEPTFRVGNDWPRPPPECKEQSRLDEPLDLLPELSAAPSNTWRPLVFDEDRRCFSFLWPAAVSKELAARFYEQLLSAAPWVPLMNTKGTSVTRSTCWHTQGQCTCDYTYGRDTRVEHGGALSSSSLPACGAQCAPDPKDVTKKNCNPEFKTVMREITEHVFGHLFPGLGQDAWPNSANVNLYRDGRQGVGWHADDESLFCGKDSDCPLVSLSLGTSREFWIALRKGDGDEMEADRYSVVEADVCAGDVLTMEGRMQSHCLHFVPKGNPRHPIRDERINITFRWVRAHRHRCPLKRQKTSLPRSLRGIFGETRLGQHTRVDDAGSRFAHRRLITGFPYVRCWSREILNCVLSDPDHLEWRLCDGCRHVCYEEGRLCCEGRNQWAGHWFCRKCWARWEPDSVPELPSIGALEEVTGDELQQRLIHGSFAAMWNAASCWTASLPLELAANVNQSECDGNWAARAATWFTNQVPESSINEMSKAGFESMAIGHAGKACKAFDPESVLSNTAALSFNPDCTQVENGGLSVDNVGVEVTVGTSDVVETGCLRTCDGFGADAGGNVPADITVWPGMCATPWPPAAASSQVEQGGYCDAVAGLFAAAGVAELPAMPGRTFVGTHGRHQY